MLVAAVVIGLIAAVSVPLDRPGIGWLGTGLAAVGALAATSRNWNARRAAWLAVAIALLAVGTFRAAGWLFVLCVWTAGVAGALAFANASSLRSTAAAVFVVPAAVVRSIPWVARAFRPQRPPTTPAPKAPPAIAAPPAPAAGLPRTPLVVPVPVRILAVAAISFALLCVFGALFASADAAFADLLTAAVPHADAGDVAQGLFLFFIGTLGLLGAAYLAAAPPDLSGLEAPPAKSVRGWEWGVPVALLDLLFTAFVLVQVTVLFGGNSHVLGAAGPTYAEYARSGFWQLLMVTLLTLAVVGLAAIKAPRVERADRILIRVLLGVLAALTLVIVASALYRMNLYERAYGYTRLRLLVSACELWLGAVFLMVLGAGVRLRARWLAQAVAGSAAAALLALAVINPDRFIADRNIERWQRTERIDLWYLSQLSADAVPALNRLPYPLRDCALKEIARDLDASPTEWRDWNLAEEQARKIVDGQPPDVSWNHCFSGVTWR